MRTSAALAQRGGRSSAVFWPVFLAEGVAGVLGAVALCRLRQHP